MNLKASVATPLIQRSVIKVPAGIVCCQPAQSLWRVSHWNPGRWVFWHPQRLLHLDCINIFTHRAYGSNSPIQSLITTSVRQLITADCDHAYQLQLTLTFHGWPSQANQTLLECTHNLDTESNFSSSMNSLYHRQSCPGCWEGRSVSVLNIGTLFSIFRDKIAAWCAESALELGDGSLYYPTNAELITLSRVRGGENHREELLRLIIKQ